MSNSVVATIATPDGPFMILENDQGRCSPPDGPTAASASSVASHHATDQTTSHKVEPSPPRRSTPTGPGEIDRIVKTPVAHFGTDLLKTGWSELRSIPAGELISYTDLASRMAAVGARLSRIVRLDAC